jgi:hypothetical protein
MRPKQGPAWHWLDLLTLLILTLFVRLRHLFLPGQPLLPQFACIVFAFSLLAVWVWVNAPALSQWTISPDHTPGESNDSPPLTPRQRHFRQIMAKRKR